LPSHAWEGLQINIVNETISPIDFFAAANENKLEKSKLYQTRNKYLMGNVIVIGDTLYTCEGRTDRFIAYNYATGKCRMETIRITAKASLYMLRSDVIDNEVCKTEWDACYQETTLLPLPAYIGLIAEDGRGRADLRRSGARHRDVFIHANAHSDGTAGATIYDYCIRMLA
jgi:hypothetical protein